MRTLVLITMLAACGTESTGTGNVDGGDPGGDAGTTDGGALAQPQVYVSTQDTLFVLDPTTRQIALVGAFDCIALTPDPNDSQDGMADIAIDKNGTMYGIGRTKPDGAWRLMTVNRTTASCTPLAPVGQGGSYSGSGLSFVPAGTLDPGVEALVGVSITGAYARYDLATGVETPITQLADEATTKNSDIVSIIGGKTYTTGRTLAYGTDQLLEIDPATGTVRALIGDTGVELIAGLGFWAGVVYGFGFDGHMYSIDPVTAVPTQLPTTGVPAGTHFWGAAVTTAAPATPIL